MGGSPRPLLTAALIVRDEAAALPRCLASIRGLVDEIVVVDTGSTDSSPRIAAEFGARVVPFRWRDDFATARNEALAHARGRWILYIDADEEAEALDREALASHLADPSLVATTVRFRPRTGFTRYHEYRLFRSDPRIRFQNVIHETIVPDVHAVARTDRLRIGRSDLVLNHYGYDGDQHAKHFRDLPLLRERLARDVGHVYSWNHLGRALAGLGDMDGALAAWWRAVAIVRARAIESPLDRLPYGSLLLRPEASVEAPILLAEALDRFPGDHLFGWVHGQHLRAAGRLAEAVACFERLAAIDGETFCAEDRIAYDARIFGVLAYEALALCHFRLGHYPESARYYARAEAAGPERPGIAAKRRLAEARAAALPRATATRCDSRSRVLALDGMLETALTHPSRLTPAALEAVLAAADPGDATVWGPTLAAILHARGDLADATLVSRLIGLLQAAGLCEPAADVAVSALEALAGTELAGDVASGAVRLLSTDGPTLAVPRLFALLRACVRWCPERLDVGAVLTLAARPALQEFRDGLLGHAIEPLLARAPDRVTDTTLERIQAVFRDCARLPYTLQLIGSRPGAPPSVRDRVAAFTARMFPARDAAQNVLARDPFALLVVLNVRIGQGDEIVRLVALLQALLDTNPALHCAVVTTRGYLYDHPRVRTVPLMDDPALGEALAQRYDGVVHVSEPGWPELVRHAPLDARVREILARQHPALVITADVAYTHFVYRSVALAGQELAASRSLDRRTVKNIYDGCQRLVAELGLSTRVAEEPPRAPDLLTGCPSTDADRAWERLAGGRARPTALVNPWGGADRLKGYLPERPEMLAAELAGLVAEGYGVILVPNGTPWGTREAAELVRDQLPPQARGHVAVAPDPSDEDSGRCFLLTERPDLAYADRIMRLFKYFVARADLVVTVEGWMGHLAYALGRPFRLVLRAQSYRDPWYPPARGPRQRLATTLSPRGARRIGDVLGPGDPAPLPSRDQKPLFLAALAGLARLASNRAVPILVRALASPDHEVRGAAIAGLGHFLPADPTRGYVVDALRDLEPLVRRAAAEALLRGGIDCSAELGPGFRSQLVAHREIARQDWPAVRRLGAAAVPALFVAAAGSNDPVRREARRAAAHLLATLGIGRRGRSDP